jgi:CHAT domain-containing protein/tetratricopeptide (TPR) repeat protein
MSRWHEATAAYQAGNTRLAMELLDDAFAAAPAANASLRSSVLLQKAEWACESGHRRDAEAALNEALRLVEQMPTEGREAEWARLQSALVQAYMTRASGDFAAAENFYSDAAALAAHSPARDVLLPDIYANQASIYMEQGKLGDAQKILVTALELDQRRRNKRSESNDLNMLGLVAKRRGDAETAKAYFQRAFKVAHESGLAREAMDAITNLNAYLDVAGDHKKAAEIFRESAALLTDAGDEARLACAIANQGIAMGNAGDFDGAVAYLTSSRELHLATGNQLHAVGDLINISEFEARLGRHDHALAHAKEALCNAEEFGLIERLWRAEYQVASGRAILGAERFRRLWEAGSSSAEEALKEPPLEDDIFGKALAGYRRAIDYIELLRSSIDHPDERHTMLTGKEQVYGAMIALCLSFRDHGWEALEVSERARMRSFLDALGSARTEQLESADPAAAGRRAELVGRLLDPLTLPADKLALMDELRTVRAELTARLPAVAAITEAELPSMADILAAIPRGTVMLVFYQLDDKTILTFALSPDAERTESPDVWRMSFGQPVENVVKKFRQEIERGDPGLQTGNELFGTLFRPVMPMLASTQNLIIVPHGALHYLPFSALWFVPAGDDTPPREYLRTRFVQVVVPSASYLPFLAQISGGTRVYDPPLVLGNPTGDLHGAEKEAQTAGAMLGVTPRLGPEASRDALLDAGSPSVLHVASHGVYDRTDPLLSRLMMADGAVTVEDLLTAGPAPGVLVLSGCVTGLSDRKPGDELIGLAQAMLRRGTRAVVATLWETFDESSALFFEHFYQALMSGAPVNEAMTMARHYLATGPGGFDQPVDWAPFVLIGDPGHRVVDLADPLRLAFNHGVELEEQGDFAGALREFRKAAGGTMVKFAGHASAATHKVAAVLISAFARVKAQRETDKDAASELSRLARPVKPHKIVDYRAPRFMLDLCDFGYSTPDPDSIPVFDVRGQLVMAPRESVLWTGTATPAAEEAQAAGGREQFTTLWKSTKKAAITLTNQRLVYDIRKFTERDMFWIKVGGGTGLALPTLRAARGSARRYNRTAAGQIRHKNLWNLITGADARTTFARSATVTATLIEPPKRAIRIHLIVDGPAEDLARRWVQAAATERLQRLADALSKQPDKRDQLLAQQQDPKPHDGSWGPCWGLPLPYPLGQDQPMAGS